MTQPAERHTVDTITSDALDHLYREIDTLTAVCRSNKQAYIGAVKDAMAADKRTEQAEAGRDRYRLAWTSARERAQALGAGVILRVADRDFWKRQTLEQRQRAERAEAERDAATALLHELGITTANPEPSWQCPDCDGLVPISQRHIHQEAEQRTRAEKAEAAIERVRAVLDRIERARRHLRGITEPMPVGVGMGLDDAAQALLAALDPQEPQP